MSDTSIRRARCKNEAIFVHLILAVLMKNSSRDGLKHFIDTMSQFPEFTRRKLNVIGVLHFPLTAEGAFVPPPRPSAPKTPDLRQLNQDKTR